ncbi:hypothetical protein [Aromatoleum tolulyticum]|uniref:hypothetical protein n=1 Tax=Aromatoleum tolulyticum TaxID=34027 RepID=UPI0009712991|nr:hypothetical protein [Aromatoleum tolulyticum]
MKRVQAGGMAVERPESWRPRAAAGTEGEGRAAPADDPQSLSCPLIPSRMKYTCSGRCKWCKPAVGPESSAAAAEVDDGEGQG